LGQLIFKIHTVELPEATPTLDMLVKQSEMYKKWTEPKNPEDDDNRIEYDIDKLKAFLYKYEDYKFTLQASILDQSDVAEPHDNGKTCKEATSSPIQK
jgi:hypothetical protein